MTFERVFSLRRQDISSHDIGYIEYVCASLTWGRILSSCVKSMWRNDIKCRYMFMFRLKNLARKGLSFLPKFHLIIGHQCNGLEPDSQAITRTNDDPRLWHHMASLSHNELGIAIIRETCSNFVIVAVYKSCNIVYIYICNVYCWDFRVYHYPLFMLCTNVAWPLSQWHSDAIFIGYTFYTRV